MYFSQDSAGEPLYKLFKAIKHQVEKGPVDAKMKKAKYTLNDTGLLGDDVEYSVLVSTRHILASGLVFEVCGMSVLSLYVCTKMVSLQKWSVMDPLKRKLVYTEWVSL